MKGFVRGNQLLSLCGLNCGLCPMNIGGYCGGCGNGNQSCKIARCSLERGKVEYCYDCAQFPCALYDGCGECDSFITHAKQIEDMHFAQRVGVEEYNDIQRRKIKALEFLLAEFNDGRRKSFFCTAVNLLELSEVEEAMARLMAQFFPCKENVVSSNEDKDISPIIEKRQRAQVACAVFTEIAARRGIKLALRRKQKG